MSSKVSAVCSIFTTKVGQRWIGWISSKILSSKQREAIFGPNINFAGNWKHPRHVVSLISFALGVPALVYSVWFVFKQDPELEQGAENTELSNRRIVSMTAIATVMSRPALHLMNMLAREAFSLKERSPYSPVS